tara:strand:+ start:1273 stop:1713 length:441 start_codon:yes stop_codon:yes gene_type:complete
MSDDDFISMSLKNILQNGIQLHLETIEEEQFYLSKLFEYMEEETEFTPYLRGEASIEVESADMQLMAELIVSQSTLFFVPYNNKVFDVFTEVLKFIAGNHEDVIREFRGIEVNKIQTIEDMKEEGLYEETAETEEESSSDDDFEWI